MSDIVKQRMELIVLVGAGLQQSERIQSGEALLKATKLVAAFEDLAIQMSKNVS